ncbi:hypothetical protein GGR52DRAFT_418157 [Hypoxylon sp. FL1284]|nr:hypothetical protein GGR52DRAFT_418157 [Hypoxylon sp. FL1284]
MALLDEHITFRSVEESPLNPYKKPETPFSASRAAPGAIPKSNAELIDSLASAADIDPVNIAAFCSGVTVWDAVTGDWNPAALSTDTLSDSGGHLGPNDILKDVPNHYLRDHLMDYINTKVAEEKREHARRTVFSDLSGAEVLAYAALIAKRRAGQEEVERKEHIAEDILGDRHVHTLNEVDHIREQADVMDRINVTIDMTPQPGFASRAYPDHRVTGSVMKQGSKPIPDELELDVGTQIDRNCDQIRAMIKIFTLQGSWTVDRFRLALGHIHRAQLTAFLDKRSPTQGVHTQPFELSWEFFKKRELLGIPNAPALQQALENKAPLQERDVNRGQKRASTGDGKTVKQMRVSQPGDKISA